ncbi:MAG: nitrogen regulation protein NR(II) [Nitrospiraceae bacterium]
MDQAVSTEPVGAELLREAFRSFGAATAALEQSYRALQVKVEQLDLELADRNEALRLNLLKNEAVCSELQAILESLSTGVLVADQQGRIHRCNRATALLLGIGTENILGHELQSFLKEQGLEVHQPPWPCPTHYPLVTKTGALITMSRTLAHRDGGQAVGTVILLHDITDLHRLEERLHRRDRLASMGEMVGRIAHEIRNPLGSVELFASMLRQDLEQDPTLRSYTEHISLAVQAMDRLLSNLLTYTRPAKPKKAWHAVDGLVSDSLTLAAHALNRSRVTMEVDLDKAPPNLWCDGMQMRQVLVNLILNAVEAMPDGGRVTIAASEQRRSLQDQPVVHLAVRDTGTGIEPAHLSRMFDPFFTTREDGTGLGLAIVHALVEGHEGRVDVESELNRGTVVTVVLPQDNRALSVQARRRMRQVDERQESRTC